jgi:phosphatidylinositol-3-phosphatase
MPSPLVWSALIAAFLGFGVLMGRATGPDSLGGRRGPLKLLVARAPTSSTPSTAPAAPPPPVPGAETTPEPSPPANTSSESKPAAPSKPSSSQHSKQQAGSEQSSGQRSAPAAKPPAIKHIFVIVLSEEPYATAFGPASPAHYLSGQLEKQGQLLVRYYSVAHDGLADEIALLSGQGPTEATATNCPVYAPLAPSGTGADGQVLGKGCVYTSSTPTLMDQLAAKHLTWKAYVEGLGEGPTTPSPCAHPAPGAADPGTPHYQTWRNPFVYFQAIAESPACATHDVGMNGLGHDLAGKASTANFTYIVPGPCDDGSPTPCAPGTSLGMMAADSFLHRIVPLILTSNAYKKNGLLAITVDQAPAGGEYADSSSCCGQPRFPNLPAPTGAAALSPQGGGQVGLLLLSPFIKKGGLVQDTYNHYSLLATIEQAFGLPRLGYAGLSEVKPFSPSLFSGG